MDFETFRNIISSNELVINNENDISKIIIEYIKTRRYLPEEQVKNDENKKTPEIKKEAQIEENKDLENQLGKEVISKHNSKNPNLLDELKIGWGGNLLMNRRQLKISIANGKLRIIKDFISYFNPFYHIIWIKFIIIF